MEKTVYCFASKGMEYIAVQYRGHAKILPIEEAFNGKNIVLLYTSLGKARQAQSTRKIYKLWPDVGFLERTEPLCTPEQLEITPLKLILDKTD
jgi:hypothetical protein